MSWVMTDNQFYITIGLIVLVYVINLIVAAAHRNKNRRDK